MDFFERAHVPKKSDSKMENNSNEAVKKQLKQMLHAYKEGNNQGIRNSSEVKNQYDFDETISSEFSEFNATTKNTDNTTETVTSNASEEQSTSYDNNSSNSNTLNTDEQAEDDSLEDITEYCEESKSLSTSTVDFPTSENPSPSFDNSSDMFECSDESDNDLSIPSSLQTSTESRTASDDEEFDADGALATKILEKLGKAEKAMKRKESKWKEDEIEANEIKQASTKTKVQKKVKRTKKPKKETLSTACFIAEDLSSDMETEVRENHKKSRKVKKDKVNYKESESKLKVKLKHPYQNTQFNDNSTDNNSLDSISTTASTPFISVSAENMSSQSLGELLGDYVHPTIRNLPTEKQNIIPTSVSGGNNVSFMFPSDTMVIKDVIDDEISSLVPEVDEDLAIDDLNIDTDTQDLIEDSIAFNASIATEDITSQDIPIEDMIPLEEMTINDKMPDIIEEIIPLKLYSGKGQFIIVMKHPAQLHIHGKLRLTALSGAVEILGYTLLGDYIDVYAPYCYHAQCMKTVVCQDGAPNRLFSKLTLAGLVESDANEIINTIDDNTAVIKMSKLDSREMAFVGKNFNITDLFSRRGDTNPRFLKKAAETLDCSFYIGPPKRSFEEKPIWDDVLARGMDNQSLGIICGGKGTGKSTFLRYYVNKLLANGPVLVLDLDPGQAEFTVPGNISATVVNKPLVGPNFTHLRKPERMLNIGMINTMDNAGRYISAVGDLITYCRGNEQFRNMPWIVNTMGMCNHMGLKFMTYAILQLQPTFLFQIDSKVPKKRFDVELNSHAIKQLYREFMYDNIFINVQPPDFLEYSFIIARHEENAQRAAPGYSLQPRDERYLNVLAYFGQLIDGYRTQGLMEIVPYEVHLKDLSIGLNVRIPEGSLMKVINGKIIALCQRAPNDNAKVFTLRDKAILCHGHGLIRGIDFEQGLLYILTPTPIEMLHLVNTLVYSDWMPELRGQEQDLPAGTPVPYRTASTVLHQRKLMYPPRRRFNPMQLLKMSRNT